MPSPPDPAIFTEACPVRRVLRLIGDKWSPIVLYSLHDGSRRFSDLQHRIPGISKKMLAQVLRELEAANLVRRTVYPTVPPRTEYDLTPTGQRMREPLAMLCRWAEGNTDLLETAEAARASGPDRLNQTDGMPAARKL